MTAIQQKFAWRGNRNELLAGYILSSIAAVTHVHRPNDYGLDLLCTLITQERDAVKAGRSFGVQVKSPKTPTIKFGGFNRTGAWKKYEIDWLFGQDQPIIVAIADPIQTSLKLYTTFWIWYLLFQRGRNLGEIILVPDEEPFQKATTISDGQWRYTETQLKPNSNGENAGDGLSYRIPLGKPIVEILGSDNDERLNELRQILDDWLSIEYLNLRHKTSIVPYVLEIHKWNTNQRPNSIITYEAWNPTPGLNIENLLRFISPAITSLLHNLSAQNAIDSAKAIIPVAKWLKEEDLLDQQGTERLRELELKMGIQAVRNEINEE